jgi:hypothetical protein
VFVRRPYERRRGDGGPSAYRRGVTSDSDRSRRPRWAALLAAVAALAACAGDDATVASTTATTAIATTIAPVTATTAAATATTTSATTTGAPTTVATVAPIDVGPTTGTYDDEASWLCRPDVADDACDGDLDATLVDADGTLTVEPFVAAGAPPIDCFYVYPTTSEDSTPNSDMTPGAERATALTQAGRFASQCGLYAPMYRQVTVAGLFGTGGTARGDWDAAYADVLDAWRTYLRDDNDGRGVVLVGHSQGASHLIRLLREEIDSDAQRALLVSALVLGAPAIVPDGAIVGGDFQDVPACTAAEQTGCVIGYASFASDAPPPEESLFGHSRGADGRALCVNPGDLAGGAGRLDTYLPTDAYPVADVSTPYVRFDGWVSAECRRDGRFDFLSVTKLPDAPASSPPLDGWLGPTWGLHLVDVNLALGNLVDVVAAQAESYVG